MTGTDGQKGPGLLEDASPVPARHLPHRETLALAAMEASPDGILMVDRAGHIVMVNAAMEAISGYASEELCGQSVGIFLPPAARDAHARQLEAYFRSPSGRPMGRGQDFRIMRKDGSLTAVAIALGHTDVSGGTAVAFVRDISDVRGLEARIRFQATHDTLTGLANRWQFGLELEQAIAVSERTGQSFALLLLDLDDFKAINDGYGHAAGERLLLEASRRLQSALRAGDTVARLGGDEFTVVLPAIAQPQDVEQVAAKLLGVLCQPYRMHGFDLAFSASLGIAVYPRDARDATTLLRYADMAMYHAKNSGRASYAFYAHHMGWRMEEKLQLREQLKIALDSDGLELHYQPQVNVATAEVESVEALLRWTHPQLGEIPPSRFIPVAEATGMILALGAWVIDRACRQIAAWTEAGLPLRVAVNLSTQQLRQVDLVEQIERSLARHGARPDLLEIEVTESEAMADPEQARQVLWRLQRLGISITLDDFGTGYSSLAYLKHLPVSRIKIDRDFLRPLLRSPEDAALVRAIVVLAQTLGLRVVAEGVESTEQLALLVRYGCDAYQGWLFSKAVAAHQIAALRRSAPPDDALPPTHIDAANETWARRIPSEVQLSK